MKEKFRKFFVKDRNLFIISLIVTGILAGLIVPALRFGILFDSQRPDWKPLRANRYTQVVLECGREHAEQRDPFFERSFEFVTQPQEIARICQALNEVSGEAEALTGTVTDARYIASLAFCSGNSEHGYSLYRKPDGSFLVTGQGRHGNWHRWTLPEQDGETLQAYLDCERHVLSEAVLFSPERWHKATLYRLEDGVSHGGTALTKEQIARCAELLQGSEPKKYGIQIEGEIQGWLLEIWTSETTQFHLVYLQSIDHLLLPDSTQSQTTLSLYEKGDFVYGRRYRLSESHQLAALPELLEEVP